MVNLTSVESRARAAEVRVLSYEVRLDLDSGDKTFESTSTIAFESATGAPTFVEIQAEAVHRIICNGEPVDAELIRGHRLPLTPAVGRNELTVEATMAYSHDGEGLHRAVDPEDGRTYVYAMTFLDAAPRVFACFDQPDLKAPLTLTVRVPEGWSVVGNSPAAPVDAAAAPEGQSGWHAFTTTRPLSTYFMTLVAGPYHSRFSEHDGIRLGLHCRQSLAEYLDKDVDELFRVTSQSFDEFHRLFGIRYPFGEYHQAFVPEFNAGAMENPGCVTFMDEHVFRAQPTDAQRSDRGNTVAHEMAHQWFGDLVTMQWWDDLWLNESFADYMGHRVCVDATEFTGNWLTFALANKAWGLDADQRSSTHPVAGNGSPDAHSALTNFDGISYSKGAVVLRQLNNYLGDEAFLSGIVDHLTRHSFGNATLADLIGSWERASGRDLSAWTDAWLLTSGVDTLVVRQGSPTVIERHNGSPSPVSRPHAVTVTVFNDLGKAESVRALLTEDVTEVPLDSSGAGHLVLPDSQDESWVRVQLDPAAVGKLPTLLPQIDDPISRAVLWGALREGLLGAQVDPASYVDILTTALPLEDNDLVMGAVLTRAAQYAGTFVHRPEHRARLETLATDLLAASPDGSNRQLLVARQFLRLCTDVPYLWSWLDGHAPDGLLVDDDMRWRVVQRLVELDAAGQDDIERQRTADPSSQGALSALSCEAALPTLATKAQVWDRIAGDESLTNHELDALCRAFFDASRPELGEPFLARYFDEMPGTVAIRNGWVVQLSLMRLFPDMYPSADALRHAEAVLARDDVDPFARRAISDGTDDLRRLLASRAAFH